MLRSPIAGALPPTEAMRHEIPTGESVSPEQSPPPRPPPPLTPGDRHKEGTQWALNPAALAARSGAHQLWGLSLPCPIALPSRLALHPGNDYLAEPKPWSALSSSMWRQSSRWGRG